jgi:hypothetical protein
MEMQFYLEAKFKLVQLYAKALYTRTRNGASAQI